MSENTVRTCNLTTFTDGYKARLETLKSRLGFFYSTAHLRRKARLKLRAQSFFDKEAENILNKARAKSGTRHISIVVGDPCFGTLQRWKFGGSPWRRLLYSLVKSVRRRRSKGEKISLIRVKEQWTTKRYVQSLALSLFSSLTITYHQRGCTDVLAVGSRLRKMRRQVRWIMICGRLPI